MNDRVSWTGIAGTPASRLSFPLALAFSLTLTTAGAAAQNVAPMAPIPGSVKNAGTYQVATGEWVRNQQTFGVLSQNALFRNDIANSYFGIFDQSETGYDEGRLPGRGNPLRPGGLSKGVADSYDILGFEIGYCALNSNPVTYTIGFFERYAPCANPTGLSPIAEIATTGLPNNGCWILTIDLTGSSAEFVLAAEGADGTWDNDNQLDDFGYRVNIDGGQGNGSGQLTHGLIYAGNIPNAPTVGDGTIFQNPSSGGTGLGTEDLFWLVSPVVADGCYFFGGCLPCANFHMALFGDQGPVDTPQFCYPAAPNSVSSTGAILESTGGFGTATASFELRDVPSQPGVLFTGPSQGLTPFGCGQQCVTGAGLLRYGPFNIGSGASQSFTATIDMSLSSHGNVQYWYRDPAGASSCGDTFNLSNGIGM